MLKKILATLFCLPLVVHATSAVPTLKEGVDYKRVETVADNKAKIIKVQEYFSYGCPWCYKLEPHVQTWLKKKSVKVIFERIPVNFNPAWEHYSRAYYAFEAMGVEKTMGPALFAEIQDNHHNFTSGEDIANFLATKGLDSKQFLAIYAGSPGMEAKMNAGKNDIKKYQVFGIPAIVVNGEYLTDSRMTNGDGNKMFEVVNYLVKKVQSGV